MAETNFLKIDVSQLLDLEHLRNGYLIYGEGIDSLMDVALNIVLKKVCMSGSGCGTCPKCKKVLSGNYVDVMTIEGENGSIKIDQIRKVGEFIANRPLEGQRKFVIIKDAATMVEQAQNSLLKNLEQPPEDTTFLLLSPSINGILPTIQSRCVLLSFRAMEEEKIAAILAKDYGVSTVQGKLIARLSGRKLLSAIALAKQEDYFAFRDKILKEMTYRYLATRNFATSGMQAVLEEEEKNIEKAITINILFLRDMLLYKQLQNSKYLYNIDQMASIRRFCSSMTCSQLMRAIDVLERTKQNVIRSKGLNLSLALQDMLIRILEVKNICPM